MDEVQEIRCTTITGLGNIMANYWLLLSSDTINSFMEPMIKELFQAQHLAYFFNIGPKKSRFPMLFFFKAYHY
jgi:hypothetical protein